MWICYNNQLTGEIHDLVQHVGIAPNGLIRILDYIMALKEQGVVNHIGASSHTPSVIQEIIDTGLTDMLMFSVNPAYDYQHGEYAFGGVDERTCVYQRCESLGIGISVMKPFSGGQLLKAETSPFGQAIGKCVCCNHCAPCPMGIDIGSVNKFYDLAKLGDDMAKEHYLALQKHASDCIGCGHCNSRCPFSVDQAGRIQVIRDYFGV